MSESQMKYGVVGQETAAQVESLMEMRSITGMEIIDYMEKIFSGLLDAQLP